VEREQAALDGTWATSDVWYGLKEGMVEIAPYNAKLPAEAVAAAETVRKAIVDGSLHPFAGPIKDQSGKEMVPAGETIPDGDLLGMDWYVEGVSA
jgi:simple sugar transport system substrate-binding protein